MAKQATPKQSTPQSDSNTPYQQDITARLPIASPEGSQAYEPINMNKNLMCFVDPNTPQVQRTYTSLTRTGVTPHRAPMPDQNIIFDGARLLNDILDLVIEIGETLDSLSVLDENLYFHGPVLEAAWKGAYKSIKELQKNRSTTNMKSISAAVFVRTSSPPFLPPDAGEFKSAVFAQVLRWEIIGTIYMEIRSQTLMQRAFRACIQCESFCDYLGAVNGFTLWFLLLTILFATWCFGGDSYHALRLEGSMKSVFLALGFHKGIQTDPSMPFYLAELRKRSIAWAHDHDKVFASFMSSYLRPPRLSRHFCVVGLPLDLSDAVVMGTIEGFLKARKNLDENGWHKDKFLLPVSRQRVQLMTCMIREEALELKIGPAVPDMEVKAAKVMLSLWQSAKLTSVSAQHLELADGTGLALYALKLEYLYTEFLLHTLLAPFNSLNRENLITTAHEIVNLVLLPTRRRDLLRSHRADMEWALVFYAMPCASVLILELMRQTQHPEEKLVIRRSGVIQNISVLISCCDSLTESGQRNYQICKQAQSIFSRSLDSILNQSEPAQRNNHAQTTGCSHELNEQEIHRQESSLGAGATNGVVQDAEWMSWLNSVGLQGDLWLESIVPTMELSIPEAV
ncbi:uncharacterized protein N7483_002601 [Penicillium malachiteum]|uniref:uncharacterized protein n=1 Tax=Penicillium malachiteum TaxID=1324776 RepID=UPI002547D422|nr:uncharacterized protein N7483_002601 [Penicillium malachiteum]KAJ5737476.1 hypothetical protein N7483_002601 [Penicillium malachiteum]